MTEVSVLDDTKPLELLKIPIDRGDVDVGGPTMDGRCEFVGRPMPSRFYERTDEQTTRGRNTLSLGSEKCQNVLDCRLGLVIRRHKRSHIRSIRLLRTYNNEFSARTSVLRYRRKSRQPEQIGEICQWG